MVNRIFWILLAVWGLVACGPNPVAVSESAPIPSSTPVLLTELPAHLETMWTKLDQGQAPKDGPPSIMWQPAYSPLFPTAWPPEANTVWVRYAYGQGQDMSLNDGVRIAKPWAHIEFRGDGSVGVIPLTQQLEPFEVQGVSPLNADTQALLQKGEQVSTYCLSLKGAPAPDSPDAVTMRRFYQSWLKYNGAIAAEIKPDHSTFFEWVSQ
jgi:hypothetical protein